VMEALKLYLDRANCIFVIGAESGIIEEAIRQRYKVGALSAEDYLDKIIQLPIVLPRPNLSLALDVLAGHAHLPVYHDASMRHLMLIGTCGNPRRIKRLANALWVLVQIADAPDIADQRRLAKVLVIQWRFPQLFKRLVDDMSLVERMTDAFMDNTEQELASKAAKLEPGIKQLYDDQALRRFLEETHEISMEKRNIERWIYLTSSQSLLPAPSTSRPSPTVAGSRRPSGPARRSA